MTTFLNKRQSLHRHIEDANRKQTALQSQLCKMQPLANIGSASCMIAHEINNILTPFGTYASLALRHLDDTELVEKALNKAVLNCQRASKVMESMLALANGQDQTKVPTNIKELVDEVFTCLCRDFEKDNIHLNIDISEDITATIVSVQIQQVLMNLILNARESMLADGGTLTISAKKVGPTVILKVSDTGTGIADEDMENIFEAFYSTKDSSESMQECFGTGLGLAFCRLIVDKHDGRITVTSKLTEGTSFRIELPQ